MNLLHQGLTPIISGSLDTAKTAVILLHGRGASPEDILGIAEHLNAADTVFVAPRARNNTWYPQRFIRPNLDNAPWLDSALNVVEESIKLTHLPLEQIVLLGFSQGACLALEYAMQTGGKFGAVIGFSGGLIGDQNELGILGKPMHNTPIFIGCDDQDFHIPLERVQQSARILSSLNANVDCRIYQGLGHSINTDELEAAQKLIAQVSGTLEP